MNVLAAIGGFVIVAVSVISGTMFQGYTLSILWGWFMVPTFHLPNLPVAVAMGVALTIRYITNQDVDCVTPERSLLSSMARTFGFPFLRAFIVLVIGWVIHRYV